MKYIPADKLIAELEQQIKNFSIMHNTAASKEDYESMSRIDCIIARLRSILAFVNSLQQEQPKQKKKCDDCPHCVDRKDQYGWHFKGCFGGPYKGKFIAEIEECPLQQEQPEVELEKEISKWLEEGEITDTRFDDYDDSDIERTARHFYELARQKYEK